MYCTGGGVYLAVLLVKLAVKLKPVSREMFVYV